MNLIANITETEIPKGERGRLHRFTIDVDMDAVGEYVLTGPGDMPWTLKLMHELSDGLMDFAQRESMRLRMFNQESSKGEV